MSKSTVLGPEPAWLIYILLFIPEIASSSRLNFLDLFNVASLFVGPAALDGRLRVGDQLIEINSQSTKNMTHGEAIELIKNGGNAVRLLVRRGKAPNSAFLGTNPRAFLPSLQLASSKSLKLVLV